MSYNSRNWNKNRQASFLLSLFFIVSFVEVIAEYIGDKTIIWFTKPLILPFLMAYYVILSKKINWLFITSLLFGWIANLLFICNNFPFIIYGVIFFIVYRMLIIYIVLNKIKMPSSIPLIVGVIPFMFIYASVTIFTYNILGDNVYLFLAQGIFTIFLGGFSLGNYIMISNKQNMLLLVSTMFMTFNQFLFLLKFYYEVVNELQAAAMILFVFGQFLLTKFMFKIEINSQKNDFINNLRDIN